MSHSPHSHPTADTLHQLDAAADQYAVAFVDLLLTAGISDGVSDIHLQPVDEGLEVRWRLDGVLQRLGTFPRGQVSDPITRLKVLADLLTYRQDTPQEGRLRDRHDAVEMRVSTFPTMRGERAVVRLFPSTTAPWRVADLGWPQDVVRPWLDLLRETSGALIVSGPAGSGKTTTGYASLREILHTSQGGRSVITIEDPCEVELPGIAQAQVNPATGFTLTSGLRSLLRQDPEVIYVGEMRDPETAAVAFQAALTGQLMLTTFHAGSAAESISRLADMQLPAYVLQSSLRAVINQRLLRRLCSCKTLNERAADHGGWPLETSWRAAGCGDCHFTGYQGRIAVAELLELSDESFARSVLGGLSAGQIQTEAVRHGMQTLTMRNCCHGSRRDQSAGSLPRAGTGPAVASPSSAADTVFGGATIDRVSCTTYDAR